MSKIFQRRSHADDYYHPIPVIPIPVIPIPVAQTAEEIQADKAAALAASMAKIRARFAKKPPAPVPQLPVWAEAARGVPNSIIRSALFGAGDRQHHLTLTKIASFNNIEISLKGESFNEYDKDLWLGLLHLARLQPLGERIEFTGSSFLTHLGRGKSSKKYEQLKADLIRLVGGVIELRCVATGRAYVGTLVQDYARDDTTKRYSVNLNPKLIELFHDGYTLLDHEQRASLGKNELAKWLYSFYCTHAKAHELKIATLYRLCRSNTPIRNFRIKLKTALARLVDVGAIKSWTITGDLVCVESAPSNAQRKHLKRRQKLSTGHGF